MYRVSLVDDEEWSLIGLRKSFKWEKYGFEVVSIHNDPEEALQRIIEIRPDIVFTDVRMPQVSGLELINSIKAAGVDSIFVVISGFAEFDYAKEALKLGTFEYCLKPVDISETDSLLERLAETLSKKKKMESEGIFKKLKEGEESVTKPICEECSKLKKKKFYQVMVLNHKQDGCPKDFFPSCPADVVYSLSDRERNVLVLSTDKDILPFVESYFNDNRPNYSGIGITSLFSDSTDIPWKIVEGDIASKSRFIFERNGVFPYKGNKSDYSLTKKLELSLYKNDSSTGMSKDAILDILDELAGKDRSNLNLEDVVLFWNHVVSFLRLNYNNYLNDIKTVFLDYDELAAKFENIDGMSEYLKSLITALSPEMKPANAASGVNKNFKQLLAYVDGHYTDYLCLQELSGKFYINTAYCCQLFKRVTGMNFSDYITTLRMKKSKALLTGTDLSIDEICMESGYNDYYYFNKVFKKYYGVTPSRFRKYRAI
jgi:YesN/AraC family two-component response regulator